MNFTFLVDENLSPTLCHRIHERGHSARHVRDLGLLSASDPVVWTKALELGAIVITLNRGDYLVLADASELHAGLIVMRPSGSLQPGNSLSRAEQWAWLLPVLEHLEQGAGADLLNTVIEVTGPAVFDQYPLPR